MASTTKNPASKSTAAEASATAAAGKGSAIAKKPPAKKAGAKKRSAPEKYSNPELRDRIKQAILAGDKGGRPGQWSARKAQMVAHEYEAEGGTFLGGKDETQQSLTAWGDEHWTTRDGKPAEREDGMHRYLPEKAWEKLSAEEQKATDEKKLKEDHKGKQFVPNTEKAKRARKAVEAK